MTPDELWTACSAWAKDADGWHAVQADERRVRLVNAQGDPAHVDVVLDREGYPMIRRDGESAFWPLGRDDEGNAVRRFLRPAELALRLLDVVGKRPGGPPVQGQEAPMGDPAWMRAACDRAADSLRAEGNSVEVVVESGVPHLVWTRDDGSWWLVPVRTNIGVTRWAVRDHRGLHPTRFGIVDAIRVARES